ncbi:LOW QUALITY PROTEIN: hypothetical protein AAY473_016464, partial [Plecturocebus cupreus]
MLPFLCPCALIVRNLSMSENMQCLIFCSCVSLLRMMVSRFIHVPTKDTNSSFLMYSMVYMCHIFLVQSIIDGHLCWFQVFATVNSAPMNIHVHVLGPQCVMLPSLCPCVLIVQHPPMSENMQCLIFCSCVSLLRMMVSRFIHVPTKDTNSSFFMAALYSM